MRVPSNQLIRLEEINLGLDEDEIILKAKIAVILDLPETDIINYKIIKKNIDSRQKKIFFVYSVDVEVANSIKIKKWDKRHRVRLHQPFVYLEKKFKKTKNKKIVIVGSGPCGLFAALLLARNGWNPTVIERGKEVDKRLQDVNNFFQKNIFNPRSNIQFGEGGAGTFSDGKLYTLINDPRSQYIFDELIKAGAPAEIKTSGAPHIGTDKLSGVIKSIRQEIIKLGGNFRFDTHLSDVIIEKGKLSAIILNNEEKIEVDDLILAIGHSARDTYQMLHDRQIKMQAKPFAIGLRIEHQAKMINQSRYGQSYQHPKLGAAKYKLVQHLANKRPVYTFCMCPGGYVMAAASEEGGVVVNGMSEYAHNGENSNSALLVPVTPSDFGSEHPLAGIEFQRRWERAAYLAGGSNYYAPTQLLGDFLENRASKIIQNVQPSYRPGICLTNLNNCLPDYVIASLREALPLFDLKIKGFADPGAILSGVETRSSAPLRLERDQFFQSNVIGLYPAGEGAGYAGGIVSSAIDGLSVAEAIMAKYLK